MTLFEIIAILLSLSALFSYINAVYRPTNEYRRDGVFASVLAGFGRN